MYKTKKNRKGKGKYIKKYIKNSKENFLILKKKIKYKGIKRESEKTQHIYK